MDILADENVDACLVAWLRQQGHDTLALAEVGPGASDDDVLSASHLSGRILLTWDLDFGEMVFKQDCAASGIILLRMRTCLPQALLARFSAAWPHIQARAMGHYIVVSNDRIRIRPMPSELR